MNIEDGKKCKSRKIIKTYLKWSLHKLSTFSYYSIYMPGIGILHVNPALLTKELNTITTNKILNDPEAPIFAKNEVSRKIGFTKYREYLFYIRQLETAISISSQKMQCSLPLIRSLSKQAIDDKEFKKYYRGLSKLINKESYYRNNRRKQKQVLQ